MNRYQVEVLVVNVSADSAKDAREQVEGELADRTALDVEIVSVQGES